MSPLPYFVFPLTFNLWINTAWVTWCISCFENSMANKISFYSSYFFYALPIIQTIELSRSDWYIHLRVIEDLCPFLLLAQMYLPMSVGSSGVLWMCIYLCIMCIICVLCVFVWLRIAFGSPLVGWFIRHLLAVSSSSRTTELKAIHHCKTAAWIEPTHRHTLTLNLPYIFGIWLSLFQAFWKKKQTNKKTACPSSKLNGSLLLV